MRKRYLFLVVGLCGLGPSRGAAQTFDLLHGFDNLPATPYSQLIEASNGALFGTSLSGGAYASGVVFKVNKDGTGFLKLHDFNYSDPNNGAYPYAGLVEGSDGALYGTTFAGGTYGVGVVFKLNKDGTGFLNLHDFNTDNGAAPYARLLEASDGALYGTTQSGGANGAGVVFKVTKGGTGFVDLHDFNYSDPNDGAYPLAGLVEGSEGALYGTAQLGGANGAGVVFKVNKDGTDFVNLHDFGGDDGANPYAGILEASDGVLYGTTYSGGVYGAGVVFKLNKDGTGFLDLHEFSGSDGTFPQAGLVEGSDGALYGATQSGGPRPSSAGVIFKINKDGTGFLNLHDFSGGDGALPSAGLVEASDSALYGTSTSGGSSNAGVVFKINKDGTGFLNLHDFGGGDGASPYAGLVEGSDGALYGTTQLGGAYGSGVVFNVNKDGTGFLNLRDFNSSDPNDGGNSSGGLVEGSDGALYGTTAYGGPNGAGVVFKINKDGTGFLKLHDFSVSDGLGPTAGLVESSDGALYGTTFDGGGNDSGGVVFKINKDGTGFVDLHDFNYSNPNDGAYPLAGLVEGSDGALYGSTQFGGTYGSGVIFKVNKDGTGFLNLHDFNSSDPNDGANCYADLIEASDSALYGTTSLGGVNNAGVVFKINKDGSGFLKLHDFNYSDGYFPSAGLIEASDDALYGTTYYGGAYNFGVVFKLNKDGSGFVKLHDFTFGDGGNPTGDLVEGTDGGFYGTTLNGGPGGGGVVFRIDLGNLPSLSISDVSVNEGDVGQQQAEFRVSLSAPSAQIITVSITTANNTATAPSDYKAESGTLSFLPGITSKKVKIKIRGDTLDEANETFFVNLTNATNASIADPQGVGTIRDDDP